MRYRKYFKRVLKERFPETWKSILKDLEQRYDLIAIDIAFAKASSNPLDKRMDFMAYFLAMIQILKEMKTPADEIRTICIAIATAYVQPKNKFDQWLKKLPPKLIQTTIAQWFLKKLQKKVQKKGHPDGFQAEIITDKEKTHGLGYGIDILECGVCKLFAKHNATAFTSLLCDVDKITSGLKRTSL